MDFQVCDVNFGNYFTYISVHRNKGFSKEIVTKIKKVKMIIIKQTPQNETKQTLKNMLVDVSGTTYSKHDSK